MAQLGQPRRRNRWIMPAVILIVGGGIAIWAAQRQTQQTADVQAFVEAVIADLAADRFDSAAIRSVRQSPVGSSIIAQLRGRIGLYKGNLEKLTVHVAPGNQSTRPYTDSVTHTVFLRFEGTDTLGLTVAYSDDQSPITLLSYWEIDSQ